MPAYRRVDAHKWRKLYMYSGAMTLLYPRFICGWLWAAVSLMHLKLLLIGADTSKPFPNGCRKGCLRFWLRFYCSVFCYGTNFCHPRWIYVKPEEVNYYEEYLGTRQEQEAEQ